MKTLTERFNTIRKIILVILIILIGISTAYTIYAYINSQWRFDEAVEVTDLSICNNGKRSNAAESINTVQKDDLTIQICGTFSAKIPVKLRVIITKDDEVVIHESFYDIE